MALKETGRSTDLFRTLFRSGVLFFAIVWTAVIALILWIRR